MAKTYFVNTFYVDSTDTSDDIENGRFHGDTMALAPIAITSGVTQVAAVAAEATANGTDAATTQALANALKTKVNAILTALKTAKVMAT